jgi:ribosome-associated protein
VVILDLEEKSSVADFFVVASGFSDRQVSSIAEHVSDELRARGLKPLSEEGLVDGRWALIDFGPVIVHVFQDHLRDFYNLEMLWPDAPRTWVKEPDSDSSNEGDQSGFSSNSANF